MNGIFNIFAKFYLKVEKIFLYNSYNPELEC